MRPVRKWSVGDSWILSAARPRRFVPHPWMASVYFDESWKVVFDVGCVNGVDALLAGAGAGGEDLEMWDRPPVTIRGMRRVGMANDPIPLFFQRLGAVPPGGGVTVEDGAVVVDTTDRSEMQRIPPRSLMACDFYVAVARASYRSHATIVDTGGSGSIVDYHVSFDTTKLDTLGSRARLMQTPKIEPAREPTLFDRLMGDYTDDGEDRQLIATIYLLAPAGETGSIPGPEWSPYVGYTVFWNLWHEVKNPPPPTPYAPIRLFTGLLGGIGDSIGNRFLALLNTHSNVVSAAVNATNNGGRFWTV